MTNLYNNYDNYPVEAFPEKIKNAIYEIHKNTGFPLPLIASSALSSISLTCQNSVDVQLPIGSVSPCSLFILLIADSGEGKTPVDNKFTKPIRDFEKNEAKKLEELSSQQKANQNLWMIEKKQIEAAIQKNTKKKLSVDNPEQLEKLDKEFKRLQQKFQDHFSKEPQRQRNYKLIFNNTTPEKLALDLSKNWSSVCLISDEAGSLLKGRAMKDLGMFNQLWDGSSLNVDRVSSPSFKINNARLTISLMVQEKIFNNYLIGRGKEARDIGFIARCLVAFPISTKGSRMKDTQPESWQDLTLFQQRITDILTQNKLDVDQGRQTKPILEFSEQAKHLWVVFRNKIEFDLRAGGYLSNVSDSASKISTNLARMAALFHYYGGCEGQISADTLDSAISICSWYIHEFARLFNPAPEVPIVVSDAIELEKSFLRWCQNHPYAFRIKKSSITQYGPSQLRKDANRRDEALNFLIFQDKVQLQLEGKTQWVMFNPVYFPIPRSNELQQPIMQNQMNYSYY